VKPGEYFIPLLGAAGGKRNAVGKARSIIFYAWAGLAVQVVLAVGVIAFVLAGAASQRFGVEDLHGRVQAMQVANLVMVSDFLEAERAARAYQATGEPALLRAFHAGEDEIATALTRVRRLAWNAVRGRVRAEQQSAQAALLAYNRAMAARPGSPAAGRLYARASVAGRALTSQAGQLRRLVDQHGDALAARNERLLGVGLGWTIVILAFGCLLPVIAMALGLRWTSVPLHAVTDAVRRRTRGDQAARATPGGPADVRELATSLNLLADESDKVTAAELERARLLGQVHQASVRIHEHLRADAIIREAVTAIHDHLTVDFVWVGIVTEERLTLAEGDLAAWGQVADIVGDFPPDSVSWIRDIYRHRSSYRVQDLRAAQAEEIPAGIKNILKRQGATSLLLTPFGAGQELLGCLTLLRTGEGKAPPGDTPREPPESGVWTQPEIEALETLAADIGRALEHARLYEGEQRLVAELKSLDRAKASFLASASHDLRTPLTSIIGYVELLSDDPAGGVRPEQASMLDGVERNARRLQSMIEDMLTNSKIELGAFTTRLQAIDLAELVPASVKVVMPSAANSGLAFDLNVPDHQVVVDGDPQQLDRLLVNLLSNAVKYTPRGGSVTMTLDTAGGAAVLTVADTGIGIPEQDQGSLSIRFFRASNAVAAAIPGSGLGLSIIRAIVTNHHGEMSLESEQDRGTTVTIRLPLRDHAHALR